MSKVLIVDDEKSLLLSLKTGLEAYKDSFEVFIAEDGKKASSIIKADNIDLMITDLKMPKMNGFELLAFVAANSPQTICIVMTAFNTPEIEKRLLETSMFKLIEKPIDFDEIIQLIKENVGKPEKGAKLPGITLPSYLQLLSMEGQSCVLKVQGAQKNEVGYFYFIKGELYDAIYKKLKGEAAVAKMLGLKSPKIIFKKFSSKKKITKRIERSLMAILLDSAQSIDEEDVPDSDNGPNTGNITQTKGENKMAELEAILEKFKVVNGLIAAGIFSPQGEKIAELNTGGIKLAEIGALANDVLLNAQKATELMEVQRGQMVHVEAADAHIIVRCLNESENFASADAGKAHVHMVVVLEAEGNVAMAKMKLASVIQETAPLFR